MRATNPPLTHQETYYCCSFNAPPDRYLQRLDELRMDVDKMQQLPEEALTSKVGSGSSESLSAGALARRRALFKGIGKGGAVLAASVPIQTLAGQTLLTAGGQHICSVSGMQSGVRSATTNVAVCGGYSPGWWAQSTDEAGKIPKRWPSTLEHGWNYTTPCKTVFVGSTLTYILKNDTTIRYPSLFQVMSAKDKDCKFSDTDEFHWVCAWLNAITHSFSFPYSGDQVIAFWNAGPSSDTYKDALSFFKTYMEKHDA
ncbi:MAG: hypothetical protein Q7T97_06360 [Burkholderiaceae bacterium]|nr:hypothetical protein [Burkholderiaceae bacterium]